MIKHYDQSNLEKKSLFHIIVPEIAFLTEKSGTVGSMAPSMVAGAVG